MGVSPRGFLDADGGGGGAELWAVAETGLWAAGKAERWAAGEVEPWATGEAAFWAGRWAAGEPAFWAAGWAGLWAPDGVGAASAGRGFKLMLKFGAPPALCP